MLGFPIRTSSDPRSVDSSPRHIAASHVLHRLPVPRHPPCALKHLQTQKPKIIKIFKIAQQTNTHPPRKAGTCSLDARNHYPQIKHHTPPPRWSDNHPPPKGGLAGLLSQSPIVCLAAVPKDVCCCAPGRHPLQVRTLSLSQPPIPARLRGRGNLVVLLRKEVIQPHLPVRLPCYDFVPIADPTFDGSLPEGLGHRLRVLPTFMT